MESFEDIMKPITNNIYGFKVKDNKVVPPMVKLPDSVVERINYFQPFREEGLTFIGLMNWILAYEEEKTKSDYETNISVVDWLPVSNEFKHWRDSIEQMHFGEMQIAVAILYGYEGQADPEWWIKERSDED